MKRVSNSPVAVAKRHIQALLRTYVILRDDGCILRKHPETGKCGGVRKDGEIILQAEHIFTRANSSTFADLENVVCLCLRHHFYFKPQHSDAYLRIIQDFLGPEKYEKLRQRSLLSLHMTVYDWSMAVTKLQAEIKKLELKKVEQSNEVQIVAIA